MTHKEAKRLYPAIFTAVHYDKRVSVEVDHSDLDLDEVMDIFQTLIMGMGYHDDAFKNWVIERADEYREAESKDFEEKLNGWKFDDEDIEVSHSNEHWNEAVDSKPTFDWESDYFGVNEIDIKDYVGSVNMHKESESEVRKTKGVTQSILDYVEFMGEATHTEMHNFYRKAFGSNSFSHILRSLIIPYKNRPTRRYLHKTDNGRYIVKLANSSNWVVVDNYDSFNTFNEAPYGND